MPRSVVSFRAEPKVVRRLRELSKKRKTKLPAQLSEIAELGAGLSDSTWRFIDDWSARLSIKPSILVENLLIDFASRLDAAQLEHDAAKSALIQFQYTTEGVMTGAALCRWLIDHYRREIRQQHRMETELRELKPQNSDPRRDLEQIETELDSLKGKDPVDDLNLRERIREIRQQLMDEKAEAEARLALLPDSPQSILKEAAERPPDKAVAYIEAWIEQYQIWLEHGRGGAMCWGEKPTQEEKQAAYDDPENRLGWSEHDKGRYRTAIKTLQEALKRLTAKSAIQEEAP